ATAIVKRMLNDSPQLDRAFQALSDPVRRGMLARLSRGPASVSELAQPFSISLPAVLQHLKALEESGLVRSEKKGRVRTVRLDTKTLAFAETWIAERRAEWEAQLDRFEDYLRTLKTDGAE
ncbi:MAG: ArsR/SmtB family transcription factor, partial [Sphingomicrobium sp.]